MGFRNGSYPQAPPPKPPTAAGASVPPPPPGYVPPSGAAPPPPGPGGYVYAAPPNTTQSRSGAGHFGANPGYDPAEAAAHPEARSGAGHFGASPGTPDSGYGSESGPGILEQWFNQRASGTDPGYEYALSRGRRDINNEFAARGGYNSGAAIQGIGDFEANMGAQREAQLDSLAGGASGEHQGRLNSMFGTGLGLAGGQAGLAGTYDTAAGNAMNTGNMAAIELMLQKAGVDSKQTQSILNNIFSIGGLLGGKGGGG